MEKASMCGRAFAGLVERITVTPIDPVATSNVELTMMRIEKSVDKYVICMYVCMYVMYVCKKCYPWPQ
jgi:hypothetical protein